MTAVNRGYQRPLPRNKRARLALSACLLIVLARPVIANYRLDFEAFKPGSLPSGLVVTRTLEEVPTWFVEEVAGGHVLAQRGKRSWETVVIPGTLYGDVRLSGRLKANGGRRVQGFVWRYQDAQNFFLLRSGGDDAGGEIPEVRVDLYYRGKRIPLGGNPRVEHLEVGTWHMLAVEHRGERIRVFLGGRQVHEIVDDYWCRLLPEKGAVGFFTFGSQALFDDLTVEDLAANPRE